MKEIWKPVVGYEGLYEVSDRGRVKSISRKINRGKFSGVSKERMMNPQEHRLGYVVYWLNKNGKQKGYLAHRLVAKAFVSNPDPDKYTEVNHIDLDKKNNTPENLEWVNRTGNIRHAFKNGVMVRHRGDKNAAAVLEEREVVEIKRMISAGDLYLKEIAKKFGVSTNAIHGISSGETWSHVPWPDTKSAKGKRFLRKEAVAEIKTLLSQQNMSAAEIAEKYNVSRYAIYSIKNGKSWKEVKPSEKSAL